MPNARTRGPAPPTGLALIDAKPGNYRLAEALRRTVPELVERELVDPFSAAILTHLPQHCYAPCALLAWSHCRWNELAGLYMPYIVGGHMWRVFASKGSEERWMKPYPPSVARYWRNVPINVQVTIVGYSTVCEAISRAQREAKIQVPDEHHSKTHVFRHLYATWRNARGDTIEEIAHALGHRSTDSTRRYIHEASSLIIKSTK